MKWLDRHTPAYIKDWPPYSPDLDIMENMWAVIRSRIYEHPVKSIDGLRKRIEKVISKVTDEEIVKFFLSFKDRLKAVIEERGGNIK